MAREMDDAEPITVASAVVVPEGSPERMKRRQESDAPETSKRLRLNDERCGTPADDTRPAETTTNPGATATTGTTVDKASDAPADPRASRRRSGLEEEKKRGKRLFGALLGTIGKFQKDSTSQRARSNAVKRKEVEAKLQEKLKAQTEELDERRKKEDDDFNLRRRVETRDFEERVMQIRNSTILAQANMLATSTTPKLYYLPWKLLPSEEDTIKAQVDAAEAIVSGAETAFRNLREQDEEELQAAGGGGGGGDGSGDGAAMDQGPEQDISINSPPRDDIAEAVDNGDDMGLKRMRSAEHTDSIGLQDARRNSEIGDTDIIEEGGEGGEDTVIY